MERRSLLKLLSVAPATVAAADAAINASDGGPENIVTAEKSDAAIRAHRIAYPYVSDRMDVHSHALYDVIRYPGDFDTPERNVFFAEPVNYNLVGTWQRKTYLDTNMDRSSSLSAPQSQLVQRILFLFDPGCDPQDCVDYASAYYWELQVGNKIFARGPMVRCAVTGTLPQLVVAEHKLGFAPGTVRREDIEIDSPHIVVLDRPVMIETQAHFAFLVMGGPVHLRRPLSYYVFLDGVGAFGVQ